MSFSKFNQSDDFLEEEAIESLLFEKIDDFVQQPIPKRKRSSRTTVDYWNTSWGLWLRNPAIHDPNSKIAKLFMLRFRVPFILYNEKILKMCITDNIFGSVYERNTVPIEFKILLSLRILGRGNIYESDS